MATSITSAGVVFPDATIQTTAAGGGGSSLEAVASGSLSDGSTVVVNSDGTVSVVAAVAQGAGTPVVFESATTLYPSVVYDSNAQKVVIAYQDGGNSSYGTAIVGTVSGTSISFGTAVVFESAAVSYTSATYDSTAQKVVISYQDSDNLSYGTSIVGTVSGTSISFGTAVVFESSATVFISSAYDSTNNKTVISYRDAGNSGYGTAVVGAISGTSISFGTPVVFESASTQNESAVYDSANDKIVIAYNTGVGTSIVGTVSGTSISFGTSVIFENADIGNISIAYDSGNAKIVIAYDDNGNSSYGTAIVGTVSGTSISFGTAVVFESANTGFTAITYDSTAQNVVIAYKDNGNSGFGTAVVGTVSGTSIGFGSPTIFENALSDYIYATYDSVNRKVIVTYLDGGNSNYGTSVVFQNAGTNLTATNFIGISNGAYTNGQTATVQLLGSVDDAQSGLTAGQKYYVQTDGTLSQTPDTPEVLAGTAVSATKLVIKR